MSLVSRVDGIDPRLDLSKLCTNPDSSRAADKAVTSLHGRATRCALEIGSDSAHLSGSAERACMVEAYHRIFPQPR